MMKTQIPDFQEFPQYIFSAYFNTIYKVNVIFPHDVTGKIASTSVVASYQSQQTP